MFFLYRIYIYSSYPKFGNAREHARKPYVNRLLLSVIRKINCFPDRDEFFFAVAIMGSIKLIFFQIFPIKGRVGLKWIPKFGNTL
jgi:hypothetical protein